VRTRLPVLVLATSLLVAAASPAADDATVVVFSGPTMGTRYTVRVAGPALDQAGREAVSSLIERELDDVDRLLSTWNPESEISRFNRHASTDPFPVDAATLSVLDLAQKVSETTGGAFDVTVAPLVEAWGFGPGARTPAVPSPETVAEIRLRVGDSLLGLDLAHRTVTKSRPDVTCDLSALAPGWAADRIAEGLARLGHENVIVDIGGEVVARGRRASGGRWRVAVESPGPTLPSVVLELEDAAVATSGDYRHAWRDASGRRYTHIIDPRTGEPVTHGLASVTVIHHDAAWADALATALVVLGPADGLALARREELGVRFVVRDAAGGYSATDTPQFDALVAGEVRR